MCVCNKNACITGNRPSVLVGLGGRSHTSSVLFLQEFADQLEPVQHIRYQGS